MRHRLAIDFDGVIHDYKNPVDGKFMGPPMRGAKEALEAFKAAGDYITIFTQRGDRPQHVMEWLWFYGIPFDEVTNIKGKFDLIIDDRAVHFTTWEDFVK